jgi:hypothetical protein
MYVHVYMSVLPPVHRYVGLLVLLLSMINNHNIDENLDCGVSSRLVSGLHMLGLVTVALLAS